jgi:6-phosphogluconolactonase (cycloisomerase 2 family)
VGCSVTTAALPTLPPVPVLLLIARALPTAFQNSPYASQFLMTSGGSAPLSSCTVVRVQQVSPVSPVANPLPFDPGSGLGIRVEMATGGNPRPTQCEIFTDPAVGFVNVVPGTYRFTVRAADSSNPALSDTEDYTLVIEAGFSITTNSPLEDGIRNRAYTKIINTNVGVINPQGFQQGDPPLTSCTISNTDTAGNPLSPGLPPGMMTGTANIAIATSTDGRAMSACQVSFTPTTPGMFQFRVIAVDSAVGPPGGTGPNIRDRVYMITVRDDYTINAFTVVDGIVNRAYSKTFSITTNLSVGLSDFGQGMELGNGPISETAMGSGTFCAATGLPAGITVTSCTLDASGTSVTATFAGTPTTVQSVMATLMLSDSPIPDTNMPPAAANVVARRTASFQFQFTIRDEFSITAFTVVDGIVNRAYSKTFQVTTNLSVNANDVGQAAEFGNGPITTCLFGGLPMGINANCTVDASGTSVTVTLAGTPTVIGQVTSSVSLTDTNIFQPPQAVAVVAANTITFNFQFTIRDEFSITAFTVVDGIRGRAYSNTFTVTTNLSNNANDVGQTGEFGNGPITACTFGGSLPAGITATSCTVGGTTASITLSGTPTNVGTAMSTLTLTDTDIFQPPQVAEVVTRRAISFTFNFTIREEFSITEPNVVDAILGRAYTKNVATNLLAMAGPSDIGQAAEFGNGPIVTCMETTGTLAAVGLTVSVDPTNASRCNIMGTPTSGGGTTILFTLAVTDNPIGTVVAAGTIMRTYSLSIRNEFDITPFTVVDGIINRTYNKTFTVATNLSNNPVDVGQAGEFGNGPITNCVVMGLPTGVMATSCTTNPSGTDVTLVLSGTPTATGQTTATIQITDSDILQNAVVVVTAATRSVMFTFTVRDEFQITEPNVVDAIFGRPYVKNLATTLVAVDPGTDVGQAAEFGNGPIATCMETTGALAGVGLSIGVDPTNASRCRISGTPMAAAGTTINITVAVTDNPIFQPPQAGAVVPANTITRNYMLTIRFEFSITEPFVVDAVNGRAYTKHINTSLLAVAGPSDIGQAAEAGNGPPAMCAGSINGVALPTGGFDIVTETNGCRLSTATTVTLAAGNYSLNILVTDNDIQQNGVTVVAGATISRTYTLSVRSDSRFLTLVVVDGITQRNYMKTLVTDKTGTGGAGDTGAGNVTMCALSGMVPAGLTIAVAANNLDCVITAAPVTAAPGTYTFTVTATDSDITQLNSSTGMNDIVVAGGTFMQAYTLVIRDEFSFVTLSVVNAVEGRGYSKLVETNLSNVANDVGQAAEFGNGPIAVGACVLDATTPSDALPTGLAAATDVTLVHCRIQGTVGAGQAGTTFGTTNGIILAATDTPILQLNPRTGANETVVPSNTILSSVVTPFQLYVRFPLDFDLTVSNCVGGTCPVSVAGRSYTNGLARRIDVNGFDTGGDAPLFYNVTAGPFTLSAGTWTGVPGSNCDGFTIDQASGLVNGIPLVTGFCSFTITLEDSGITQPSVSFGVLQVVPTTPPGSAVQAFSIEVRPELTIVNASLPGGLKDNPYMVTLAVVNGLSANGAPVGLPAVVTWTETSGNLGSGACTGLMLTDLDATAADQRATISGTPTVAGDCIVTIRATDDGNAPGVGQFVPSGFVEVTFTIVINDSIGFVTNSTGGNVRVIRTDTNTATANTVSFAGSAPEGIAVNPVDPLFAYVANGTGSGNVGVFCTRVEGAVCPVAFQPPVGVPSPVMFTGNVSPTDVAVSATTPVGVGAFGASIGWYADPNFVGVCPGGAGFLFPADRTHPNFNVSQLGICFPGARRVAIGPALTQQSFLLVNGSDNTYFLGVLFSGAGTFTIPVGGATLSSVAVSPDGRFAYFTDTTNGQVHVVDITNPLTPTYVASTPAAGTAGGLQLSAVPMFIEFAPDGRYAYVTEDGNNVIAAIDPATLDTTMIPGTVQVTNNNIMITGGAPRGIALTEESLKAFVANAASDSVGVIDTNLASGTFQTELTDFNGAGNFSGPFGVDVMKDPHLHINNPLPAGIIGIGYDFSIVATGGTRPYIFSVAMGPFTPDASTPPNFIGNTGTPCDGFTITGATGNIMGVPTTAGACTFTAMVTDASTPTQMATRVLTITVVDPGNLLAADVEDAINGRTYSKALTAAGLPFSYQNPGGDMTSLNTGDPDCAGLSMNVQGRITGTAFISADGVCPFQVDLIGSGGMSVLPGGVPMMYTLTIRQEFSVTEGGLVDAVTGRIYTKHINTDLALTAGLTDFDQAEFGNGPAANCTATINGGPLTGTGFTIVAETNGCRLMAGAVTLAPGMYTVVINVTDNAIPDAVTMQQVVPANTIASPMFTLNVRAEFNITEPFVVDGIAGRAYVKDIDTDIAVNGVAPLTACTGSIDGNTLPFNGFDIAVSGNSCQLFAASTHTLAAGNHTLVVTAMDTAFTQFNSSTGMFDTVTPSGMRMAMYTFTIRADFAITEPFVVDAIAGRTYTKHIDTSLVAVDPGTDVGQTAEAGNGPPATCMATIDGAPLPAGVTFTIETNGCLLTATGAALTGLGAGPHTLEVMVTDNDILQDAVTVVTADTKMFTFGFQIRDEFSVTEPFVVPGVVGRAYSKLINTNLVTTDPGTDVGQAEFGNGPAAVCTATIDGNALPFNGFDITPSMDGCLLTAPSTHTLAMGSYTLVVTVTDNNITQDGVEVVPFAMVTSMMYTLEIRSEFMITSTAPALPDAVSGQPYNFTFTVNTDLDATGAMGPGNGPVSACSVTGLPTGLMSTFMANGADCDITISGTPTMTGPFALTISVTDTAIMQDAATVVSAFTRTQAANLMVVAGMTVTLVTDCPGTCAAATFDDSLTGGMTGVVPDAVNGRVYGDDDTGTTAQRDLLFTVMGGIAPYSWMVANLPAGITCTEEGANNEMFRCNSDGNLVTGMTSDFSFTVTDTGNAAVTPGMQDTDVNGHNAHTLPVAAALVINNNSLPNGLVDFPYSVQFTATGGLPAPMSPWVAPGAMAGGCSGGSTPTGTLPPGTSLDASTGMLTATALTMASTTATEFTFQICYTDTSNDTTPAGAAFPPVDQNTGSPGNDYVVNVLARHAYVAAPGTDRVEVVDTAGDTQVTNAMNPTIPIDVTGGNVNPRFLTMSPDGRFLFVGIESTDTVDVIDTITKTVVRNIDIDTPCFGDIRGMAAADVPTRGTRVYVICEVQSAGQQPNLIIINVNDFAFTSMGISDNGDILGGVAFSPDGTRAYLTNDQNEIVVFDTVNQMELTASRFVIGGAADPRGIAIVPNTASGNRLLAYIAKFNSGNTGAVAVVDVTTDTLAAVTERNATASNTQPFQVAARAVPSGGTPPSHVFVSQFNSNTQYIFMDNAVAMPTLSAVTLTDVATGSRQQGGVTAPPVPSGTPKVYFTIRSNNNTNGNSVYSVMDLMTPDGGARIDLTDGTQPEGITHTPQPSGLVLDGANLDRSTATTAPLVRLPDATDSTAYDTTVAVQGGVGVISFASSAFSAGTAAECGTLTISATTGRITGTAGTAGTCILNLVVSDAGRVNGVLRATLAIVVN